MNMIPTTLCDIASSCVRKSLDDLSEEEKKSLHNFLDYDVGMTDEEMAGFYETHTFDVITVSLLDLLSLITTVHPEIAIRCKDASEYIEKEVGPFELISPEADAGFPLIAPKDYSDVLIHDWHTLNRYCQLKTDTVSIIVFDDVAVQETSGYDERWIHRSDPRYN